jgi:hypothetical protein
LEEQWISIPQRFIVYQSMDSGVADPYTVVYPDGAVFVFYAQPPHRARFLCRYTNFSKDEEDELIDLVPESLMEAIINQEV